VIGDWGESRGEGWAKGKVNGLSERKYAGVTLKATLLK